MKYRADIDGLRALAVLSVVGFHFGFNRWIGGGYVGVDIFFVISGFLITKIIYADIASRSYSIVNFYHRRARRIFPALFVVLAACMVAAYVLRFPSEVADAGKGVLASLLFVSNIFFYRSAGYFDGKLATDPTLHTWSLSVEEQFYILFPVLVFCIRSASIPRQKLAIAAVFLVSLVAAVIEVHVDKDAAFYLVVFRAWELLAGAVIALDLVPKMQSKRLGESLAIAGVAAILYADFRYSSATLFPGLAAVLPCIGTAAIIHAGSNRTTLVSRALSLRPIRFVGLISYSLYLWHWPLWVFSGDLFKADTLSKKLGLLGLAILLATISCYLVERPFRKPPYRLSPKKTLGASLLAMVCLGAIALAIGPVSANIHPVSVATQKLLDFDDAPSASNMRTGTCFMTSLASSFAAFEGADCLGMSTTKPNVLIIGDSHAAHLWSGYAEEFPAIHFLQSTASGCKPVLNPSGDRRCVELMQYTMRKFLPRHHLQTIILSARWTESDVSPAIGTAKALLAYADRVVVSGPIEEYGHSLPRLLASESMNGLAPGTTALRFLTDDPVKADRRFASWSLPPGVGYVSVYNALCTPTCLLFADEGVPLQFDYGHLTRQGSRLLASRVGAQALGMPSRTP